MKSNKLLVLSLTALLSLGAIVGCGSKSTTTTTPATETPVTQTPATEAPTTAAPTTETPSTQAPTEAPTTEAPTEASTTEAPTETPTEAPTETPTEEPTETPTEEPTSEATETPSEDPSSEVTVNYGTAEAPLNVSEGAAIAATLENKAYSEEQGYVSGVVVSAVASTKYAGQYTFYIAADANSTDTFKVDSCILDSSITAAPVAGDAIMVHGYFEKYNDVGCMYFKTVDSVKVYPTVLSVDHQSYPVSVTGSNASIAGLSATAMSGSTQTFTVEAHEGYKVGDVTLNGKSLTAAENGSYSFIATSKNEVSITVVEDDAPVVAQIYTQDFSSNTRDEQYKTDGTTIQSNDYQNPHYWQTKNDNVTWISDGTKVAGSDIGNGTYKYTTRLYKNNTSFSTSIQSTVLAYNSYIDTLTFNSQAKTAGATLTPSYSLDGGTTWVDCEAYTPTTTATDVTVNINATATALCIKFTYSYTTDTAISANMDYYLDDIVIKGYAVGDAPVVAEDKDFNLAVWGRYLSEDAASKFIEAFKAYCTENSIAYDSITYTYYDGSIKSDDHPYYNITALQPAVGWNGEASNSDALLGLGTNHHNYFMASGNLVYSVALQNDTCRTITTFNSSALSNAYKAFIQTEAASSILTAKTPIASVTGGVINPITDGYIFACAANANAKSYTIEFRQGETVVATASGITNGGEITSTTSTLAAGKYQVYVKAVADTSVTGGCFTDSEFTQIDDFQVIPEGYDANGLKLDWYGTYSTETEEGTQYLVISESGISYYGESQPNIAVSGNTINLGGGYAILTVNEEAGTITDDWGATFTKATTPAEKTQLADVVGGVINPADGGYIFACAPVEHADSYTIEFRQGDTVVATATGITNGGSITSTTSTLAAGDYDVYAKATDSTETYADGNFVKITTFTVAAASESESEEKTQLGNVVGGVINEIPTGYIFACSSVDHANAYTLHFTLNNGTVVAKAENVDNGGNITSTISTLDPGTYLVFVKAVDTTGTYDDGEFVQIASFTVAESETETE